MQNTLTMVVDSDLESRKQIAEQLKSATFSNPKLVKTLVEAKTLLAPISPTTGILYLSYLGATKDLVRFVDEVRSRSPELAIVVIFENIAIDPMRDLILCGVDQFLQKPFSKEALMQRTEAAFSFRQRVLSEAKRKPNNATFSSFYTIVSGAYSRLALQGFVDENASLPELPISTSPCALFIDCNSLLGMNSIGIRAWIIWLKRLSGSGYAIFEFENIRSAVLKQAALVHGFVPRNGKIRSFFVSYLNEETGVIREFRFVYGKDYSAAKLEIPDRVDFTDAGKTMTYQIEEFWKSRIKSLVSSNAL